MLARSTLLLTTSGSRQRRRPATRNRAFDGIDNASMAFHLAPTDQFKPARRDFSDQQLFSDYRRRSLTADSETTSTAGRAGGEHELPSTTPVGSYINGVLGGLRHPGLAGVKSNDELDEADADEDNVPDEGGPDEAAAIPLAAGRSDGQTLARAASDSLVRLRAENARLAEKLRTTEQRLRQMEREKSELAEKAGALVDELEEAKEELRDERRLTAALRSQKEEAATQRRAHFATAESVNIAAASPVMSRTSLDCDLEQASRRMENLERSMLEMKRRFTRLEDAPQEPSTMRPESSPATEGLPSRAEAAEVTEVPAAGTVSSSLAMAAGAMSQEIAELRANTESMRRRMAQQEEWRKQQLLEVDDSRVGERRANEDALFAVSLGLETARAQNAELRKLLDRSEREKSNQGRRLEHLLTEYGQMRSSAVQTRQAWEEWAAQVEAGREELRQLGDANSVLRDRLTEFDQSLNGLQRDLEAAKAEAALKAEQCRRLTADVDRSRAEARRARDAEAKASQLGAGMSKLLALADAENRGFQRRLGVLAEAAQRSAAPELGRHLRDLAYSVRTDFQVAASDPSEQPGTVHRHSHIQLAALIEQIDMVETRSDHLLMARRQPPGDTGTTPASPDASQLKYPNHKPNSGAALNVESQGDRADVQRLMRMLLYNAKNT